MTDFATEHLLEETNNQAKSNFVPDPGADSETSVKEDKSIKDENYIDDDFDDEIELDENGDLVKGKANDEDSEDEEFDDLEALTFEESAELIVAFVDGFQEQVFSKILKNKRSKRFTDEEKLRIAELRHSNSSEKDSLSPVDTALLARWEAFEDKIRTMAFDEGEFTRLKKSMQGFLQQKKIRLKGENALFLAGIVPLGSRAIDVLTYNP